MSATAKTIHFPNQLPNQYSLSSLSCKLRSKLSFGRDYHGFLIIVYLIISGLSLLKVDGRMVYSTCSMNPVENEAVVAEVICQLSKWIFEATIIAMIDSSPYWLCF